jgi:hypothetical protein
MCIICMYVYMCVCIYTHIYIHAYMHAICIHMYICIYSYDGQQSRSQSQSRSWHLYLNAQSKISPCLYLDIRLSSLRSHIASLTHCSKSRIVSLIYVHTTTSPTHHHRLHPQEFKIGTRLGGHICTHHNVPNSSS